MNNSFAKELTLNQDSVVEDFEMAKKIIAYAAHKSYLLYTKLPFAELCKNGYMSRDRYTWADHIQDPAYITTVPESELEAMGGDIAAKYIIENEMDPMDW